MLLSLVGKLEKNKQIAKIFKQCPWNCCNLPIFRNFVNKNVTKFVYFCIRINPFQAIVSFIYIAKCAKSTCGKVSIWEDFRIWLGPLLKLHSFFSVLTKICFVTSSFMKYTPIKNRFFWTLEDFHAFSMMSLLGLD